MTAPLRNRLVLAREESIAAVQDSPSRPNQRITNAEQIRYQLSRASAFLEYCAVYMRVTIFGVSSLVRYLRNPNPRIAGRLLRAFGAAVGNHTTIKRGLILDNVQGDQNSTGDFSHLKIGDNCYIGDCVFFDLASEIVIENEAVISGRASFITHAECKRSSYLSQRFPRECGPIVVGRGAWVGFGATVLHGVTIGPNSVIGANALLLQNTEPYSVYGGIPARMLKRIH